MMLALPSPFPSTPEAAHVDGRNCMGPMAPALEGPMFCPWLDSTCPTAARTYQSLPNPYFSADSLYSLMYSRFGIGATGRAKISSRAMPSWYPLSAVLPPVAARDLC